MKKLPIKRQIRFCRQLSSLTKAGVPVVRALEIAEVPFAVKSMVLDGKSISDSMAAYFSGIVVSLVKIGEKTGEIDRMFLSAAQSLETEKDIKEKVVKSFIYPAFVLSASFVSIIFFIVFIIPQIQLIFESMNVALPASVAALINTAPFILPSLLGIFLFATAWYMCARKNIFTAQREFIKFNFPLLGDTAKKFTGAKIVRMLATLMKSSVPAVEALQEAISSQESAIYRAALERVKDRVENGSRLSEAFSREPYFEKTISRMLLVGEESGQTEEILEGTASVMEEEAQNKIKILTSVIEPASTVFVGIIVGFIVITMMSPMVKILSSLE